MKKVKALLALIILAIGTILVSNSYAKYVLDKDIVAITVNIDRTNPVGIVNYSTEEKTNEDVFVTINLSEPILELEGWELSEDQLTLTKKYTQNITEIITIEDLSGNEGTVEINIQNIDNNDRF